MPVVWAQTSLQLSLLPSNVRAHFTVFCCRPLERYSASENLVKTVSWFRLAGPLEEGIEVYAEGAARSVGKVVAAGNSSGTNLALLRLQAAFGDRQLRAGSKEGPVIQPHRPSWWPPEWGAEEQEQQ